MCAIKAFVVGHPTQGIIDRDLLDREIAAEKADAAELETRRRQAQSMLAGLTL